MTPLVGMVRLRLKHIEGPLSTRTLDPFMPPDETLAWSDSSLDLERCLEVVEYPNDNESALPGDCEIAERARPEAGGAQTR